RLSKQLPGDEDESLLVPELVPQGLSDRLEVVQRQGPGEDDTSNLLQHLEVAGGLTRLPGLPSEEEYRVVDVGDGLVDEGQEVRTGRRLLFPSEPEDQVCLDVDRFRVEEPASSRLRKVVENIPLPILQGQEVLVDLVQRGGRQRGVDVLLRLRTT